MYEQKVVFRKKHSLIFFKEDITSKKIKLYIKIQFFLFNQIFVLLFEFNNILSLMVD